MADDRCRSRPLRALLIASVLMFGTFAPGCAAMIAEHAHIEAATSRYAFQHDQQTVLAAARTILFTEGYQVRVYGPASLETGWRLSHDGDRRSRRLVVVVAAADGTRLSVMRASQGRDSEGRWSGQLSMRDASFELQVIEQLDPSAAAEIRVGAGEAAQQARR